MADTSPQTKATDAHESAQDASEIATYGGFIIAESIASQNRTLIAAAPELLAACEAAMRVLCDMAQEGCVNEPLMKQLKTAVCLAYGAKTDR